MILIGLAASVSSDEPAAVPSNAVLVIDLVDNFTEKEVSDPFSELMNPGSGKVPSLSTVIGLIQQAKKDSNIKGIYIKCQQNSNGYASSEELRKALVDFKKSNKFIFAYGETISQKGYWVGNVANGIYTHPQGGLEFSGFSLETVFLKGMLDKLEVEGYKPRIKNESNNNSGGNSGWNGNGGNNWNGNGGGNNSSQRKPDPTSFDDLEF